MAIPEEILRRNICIVFRDPSLGGKSIEHIFKGLLKYWSKEEWLYRFTYSKKNSFFKNIYLLRSMPCDLFHFSGGSFLMTYILTSRKFILTIHDIGRYKEIHGLKKWIYKWLLLRIPLKRAIAVTTVSHYTRDDILFLIGKHFENKIKVIPNPVPATFHECSKEFTSGHPRILYVGTHIHKNLESAIKALSDIDCKLVILGHLTNDQRKLLSVCRVEYENYYDLGYQEVYREYCLSDFLIFVSLHEGFGMPVIEAQAVGRPVIASRIKPHEEIAGDSVCFIDNPLDHTEIQAAVIRLINDENYRKMLVEKGKENIKRFHHERIALMYESVYNAL